MNCSRNHGAIHGIREGLSERFLYWCNNKLCLQAYVCLYVCIRALARGRVKIINTELTSVADWFCANRLTLNLNTNNFILFKSNRKFSPRDSLCLLIKDVPISQVQSTNFLGVCVDQHLTWNEHINHI